MICLGTKLQLFLLFSTAVVTVLGSMSVIIRDENSIYIWNSTFPQIKTFPFHYVLSLSSEELDISRNVYVLGETQLPNIYLFNIITHGTITNMLDESFRLMSMVANNGFVYALLQRETVISLFEIDIDESYLKNIIVYKVINNVTPNSQYMCIPGNPLVYDSTTQRLYTEVEYLNSNQRIMVEIVINNITSTMTMNSLDWITGWTKLWYFPSCPKQFVGFMKGSLYSIDMVQNQTNLLFSPPTLNDDFDIDPLVDIDPSTGEIYTLSNENEQLILTIFNFIGKQLHETNLPSISNTGKISGLQVVPEQSGIIGNCPIRSLS